MLSIWNTCCNPIPLNRFNWCGVKGCFKVCRWMPIEVDSWWVVPCVSCSGFALAAWEVSWHLGIQLRCVLSCSTFYDVVFTLYVLRSRQFGSSFCILFQVQSPPSHFETFPFAVLNWSASECSVDVCDPLSRLEQSTRQRIWIMGSFWSVERIIIRISQSKELYLWFKNNVQMMRLCFNNVV